MFIEICQGNNSLNRFSARKVFIDNHIFMSDLRALIFKGSHGVAVITSALHAEGLRFDPG